jgi:hypothetical protein
MSLQCLIRIRKHELMHCTIIAAESDIGVAPRRTWEDAFSCTPCPCMSSSGQQHPSRANGFCHPVGVDMGPNGHRILVWVLIRSQKVRVLAFHAIHGDGTNRTLALPLHGPLSAFLALLDSMHSKSLADTKASCRTRSCFHNSAHSPHG